MNEVAGLSKLREEFHLWITQNNGSTAKTRARKQKDMVKSRANKEKDNKEIPNEVTSVDNEGNKVSTRIEKNRIINIYNAYQERLENRCS